MIGRTRAARQKEMPGGMDQRVVKLHLSEERARLEREIETLEAELAQSLEDASEESPYDQHMAETAAATLDREIVLTLEGNAQAAIAHIDRAMQKLDDGSYGRCDRCGLPIGEDRLRAAPFANLCIECKRREERRG
jgi:DnaK suppressor protein